MQAQVATAATILLVMASGWISASEIDTDRLADEVRAQQIRDLKFGMFVCWSFSSVSGKEWTQEPHGPDFFRVTGCDTDQWCKTARSAHEALPISCRRSWRCLRFLSAGCTERRGRRRALRRCDVGIERGGVN